MSASASDPPPPRPAGAVGPGPIEDLRNGVGHLLFRYYLPSGLATTGAMILVPTLPVFLESRTDSLTALTLILAAAAVGGLAANLPAGTLVERFGERAGFVGGILLNGIGVIGLLSPGPVAIPFLACLVAGAGQSARLLARQTYSRRAIGLAVRGRLMSLFGGIGRVALLVGPLAGGFVGEWVGLRAAFAVAAGVLATAAVVATVAGPGLDHGVGFAPPGLAGGAGRAGVGGYRRMWRSHRRSISLVGLGMTGAALIRVGRLTIIPLYGSSIGLDLSDVGVVVAIAGGLDLILFPLAGWLMDAYGRLYAVVPSLLIMAAGLALLPLASSFAGLAGAALLIGLGNGIGSGTMLTYSTDLAPVENPAQFLGLIRVMSDLGRILGPIVVGFVADRADLGVSSMALAAVGAGTAALFAFAIGEPSPSGSDQKHFS